MPIEDRIEKNLPKKNFYSGEWRHGGGNGESVCRAKQWLSLKFRLMEIYLNLFGSTTERKCTAVLVLFICGIAIAAGYGL